MKSRTWITRLLIGAGIVASIASQPPSWRVQSEAEIPLTDVPTGATMARFIIHTELYSSVSDLDAFGYANINFAIDVGAAPPAGYAPTLRVRSLSEPDAVPTDTVAYLDNSTGKYHVSGEETLWYDCLTPCAEDIEATLSFPAQPADLARRITGHVDVDARADGDNTPRGTEIVVAVEAAP